jgi:hypothetical protein
MGSSISGNQPECTAVGDIGSAVADCPALPEVGDGAGSGLAGQVPAEWLHLPADIREALARAGISLAALKILPDMKIYRVYGGCAPQDGRSWTPINPRLIEALGKGTFRDLAGLPFCNTGTFLAEGELDIEVFPLRLASTVLSDTLDGNIGGLPEIRFFNRADVRSSVHNITLSAASPPF